MNQIPKKPLESHDSLDPLTEVQRSLVEFIYRFFQRHQYYPLLKEIAEGLSKSVASVQDMVEALERKGWLTRLNGRKRNIRFTDMGFDNLKKTVVG